MKKKKNLFRPCSAMLRLRLTFRAFKILQADLKRLVWRKERIQVSAVLEGFWSEFQWEDCRLKSGLWSERRLRWKAAGQ